MFFAIAVDLPEPTRPRMVPGRLPSPPTAPFAMAPVALAMSVLVLMFTRTWAGATLKEFVCAVVLGVLGLLVITSESRHPAPLTTAAGPERVEVAAPEDTELSPVERAIGEMRTR